MFGAPTVCHQVERQWLTRGNNSVIVERDTMQRVNLSALQIAPASTDSRGRKRNAQTVQFMRREGIMSLLPWRRLSDGGAQEGASSLLLYIRTHSTLGPTNV